MLSHTANGELTGGITVDVRRDEKSHPPRWYHSHQYTISTQLVELRTGWTIREAWFGECWLQQESPLSHDRNNSWSLKSYFPDQQNRGIG